MTLVPESGNPLFTNLVALGIEIQIDKQQRVRIVGVWEDSDAD